MDKDKMTIDQYLANHSKNRMIDNAFKAWYAKKYTPLQEQKSKTEWDKFIFEFNNDTPDKKPEVKKLGTTPINKTPDDSFDKTPDDFNSSDSKKSKK